MHFQNKIIVLFNRRYLQLNKSKIAVTNFWYPVIVAVFCKLIENNYIKMYNWYITLILKESYESATLQCLKSLGTMEKTHYLTFLKDAIY